MLALFFQLKMMQSLQFIATLYDDLSEVTGKSAAPPPPFRQALTHMLTATKDAVVSEIDKQPGPVQAEFATLKTSLTDPNITAPVKLQIPPNQFEAVKQKTYVKLNKPYTAPPTANSAPVTVPPANTAPANANTAPPPSVDPYAGSNYPGVNVIDMYKVSTGATWDPAQPAFGYGDTGLPRKLNSAELEYVQHTNNDVELTAYSVYNGSKEQLNRYYYKTDERQWYAAYLNTYAFDYVTPAYSLPINVVFRDPYHKEKSANFTITPENYDIMTHTSSGTPGTITTVNVPYTVGPPTANTLPHDMHDMSVQVSYTPAVGTSTVSGVWAAMPLMNPLAAIAPVIANTIATFSTDGLVNVNDATPVEYDVQWQAEQLEIKVEQADDGSVKVTYHSPRNPGAAMFSNQPLGTFIHKDYQWYVDPTTYKSYNFISSTNEMNLYQLTYLPDGELDMDGTASHLQYNIPRDGFVSVPLLAFSSGNFMFNGSSHNGTENLWTPLTKQPPE